MIAVIFNVIESDQVYFDYDTNSTKNVFYCVSSYERCGTEKDTLHSQICISNREVEEIQKYVNWPLGCYLGNIEVNSVEENKYIDPWW
jgi:hypothetical protein